MYLVSECVVCVLSVLAVGAVIFVLCVLLLLIDEAASRTADIMLRAVRQVVTLVRAQQLVVYFRLPGSMVKKRYP